MNTPDDVTIPAGRGPILVFTSPNGQGLGVNTTFVDREAVQDPRERAICRALLLHALSLLDQAELESRFGIPKPEEAQS